MLLPEIERQQESGEEVVFRAAAALTKPEIYEVLEERWGKDALRLPASENRDGEFAAAVGWGIVHTQSA